MNADKRGSFLFNSRPGNAFAMITEGLATKIRDPQTLNKEVMEKTGNEI
jgi:hypothetical protein